MKPNPYEWDEDDVYELIKNQVEEHLQLDYKASDALQKSATKKAEISKDISAFANSAGGTILYGVPERDAGDGKRLPGDPDGVVPAEIPKEWLEQVINSNIHPKIDGIRINPIPLGKTLPGRVCYAVVVPESYTAHQASDYRYYKRFNFQSAPMEDYEVRLVMNKVRYPLLEPTFGYKLIQEPPEGRRVCRLTVDLSNKGMVRAIDIALHLWWPHEAGLPLMRGAGILDWGIEQIGQIQYQHFVCEVFGSKRVIFPSETYRLIAPDAGPFHFEYEFSYANWERSYLWKVRWRLHAGDAPPREGEVAFSGKLSDL